jgi:AraC family transcriptional regulator, regulatory protein of adaptative response / methylated-DNA-[protein]-cysteine methyltransferase
MPAQPAQFVDGRDFARIARAIRYIVAHFREQPDLATMAQHVGLSAFHFNRLFRRWAGLTPRQYLAFVTGVAARAALEDEASVLAAAHAVGLSGPGRLHDLMVTLEAASPGECRARGAGLTISFGFSDSPFGRALLARTPRGVCQLSLHPCAADAEAELREHWPRAAFVRDDASAAALAGRIWSRAGAGHRVPLHVAGTNFQLQVWRALLERGSHELVTYADLARAVGAPAATRAVGNAVGANPVAWLIPCHHVLRTGGGLGGYRWGLDPKRAMLAWEALSRTPLAATARAS